MLLAVDANILVAELTRRRGRELLAHPDLTLVIAERAADEARHELDRRLTAMERQGRILPGRRQMLLTDALGLAERHVSQVPTRLYAHLEEMARRRVPRDPRDWPTVALALALNAAIWTRDTDFLGCGVATWTTETLLLHLAQ